MKRVDAYIDYQFKGNFKSGNGKYSVVLEYIDDKGIPHTREHYCGYSNTTNNRLCMQACITALENLKESCEIEIHLDSVYMESNVKRIKDWMRDNWTSNGKEIKNKDLWQQYLRLASSHLVSITNSKRNSYSEAMEIQLNNRRINYV